MKDTILKQYKPENYDKLSVDEKKNLIIQTIRTIQDENNLDKCDIEFKPGLGHFGFDFKTKKIVIDLEMDITSYDMLCALIHELRHQWQLKKEGKQPQIGQGRNYIISRAEKDAYEYSISQMLKYSEFFNDDAFDLNLIDLINEYISKRNRSKIDYEICGYSGEDILPEMISYMNLTSVYDENEKNKNDETEQIIPFRLDKSNSKQNIEGLYSYNDKTGNLLFRIWNGMEVSLINGELYIRTIDLCDDIPLESVVTLITETGFECIKHFKEIGLNVEFPSVIHFPPALIGRYGMKKNSYIEMLNHLNCNEKREVSLDDIRNCDKNYIVKGTVDLLKSISGEYIDFGINYLEEYTPQQVEVLDKAIEWMLDLDDLKYDCEPGKKVKGFYAGFQFKKEYSPQKLDLILKAQKQGLNTLFYDKLNEEQIKKIMQLQLAGIKRSDWINLVHDKNIQFFTEDSSSRPKDMPYSDERIARGVINFNSHEPGIIEQQHNKDKIE